MINVHYYNSFKLIIQIQTYLIDDRAAEENVDATDYLYIKNEEGKGKIV